MVCYNCNKVDCPGAGWPGMCANDYKQEKQTPIETLQSFLDDINGVKKPNSSIVSNSVYNNSVTLPQLKGFSYGGSTITNSHAIVISTAKTECYFKHDKSITFRISEKKPNWFIRLMHYYILGIVWKDL